MNNTNESINPTPLDESDELSRNVDWLREELANVLKPLDAALADREEPLGPRQRERLETVLRDARRLHSAEMLRSEAHRLEVLNQTARLVAAEIELERLVQAVTDAATELTGAKFGAFFYNIVNADGESYRLYTLSGASREDFARFPQPRNTAVFGATFNGEGVVRSGDIRLDPRYGRNPPYYGLPDGHLPVVSYLAVPVIGPTGEVLGGLFFAHPMPNRFTEQHELIVIGIAAQAAIAFEKARLYEAARTAEADLRKLNESLEQRVADEVAERMKAEEALRQAQKMEAIGQLTGGVAHDFNNLLQVVLGNLEALKGRLGSGGPPANFERLADAAIRGAERAASLTQRLLAFARRQPLDPRRSTSTGWLAACRSCCAARSARRSRSRRCWPAGYGGCPPTRTSSKARS